MKKCKFLLLVFLIIACIGLTSCGAKGPLNSSGGDNSNNNIVIDSTNKIIYTVDYKIYSDNINEQISKIGEWLREYKGYISESEQEDIEYAVYVYKVPTESLNSFLDNIDSLEGISNKNVSTKDVTSSYNELEAQVEMLTARKKAYMSLLEEEGLSLSKIAEINRLLDDIEVKLIAATKDLDQLKNKVDYSTVTIRYYKNSNTEAYQFFNSYFSYLIVIAKTLGSVIMYSLPFAIVGGGIYFGIVTYKKKIKKNEEVK